MARISNSILDSKFETHILPDCTVHTLQVSDPNSRQRLVTRSEHWRRQKRILLGHQGRYSEAEAILRRAEESGRKVLGPIHKRTLEAFYLHDLCLRIQQQNRIAEPGHLEPLEGQKELRDLKLPMTPGAKYRLGLTSYYQKRYAKAEATFRRALEQYKTSIGPTHSNTLSTAYALGKSLYSQHKYGDAVPQLRQVLEGREKVLGLAREETLDTAYSLALALYELSKYDEAETLLRQAPEGYKKVRGPVHKIKLGCAYILGETLHN